MTRAIFSLIVFAMLSSISFGQNNNLKEKYLKDSLTIITKRVERSIIKGRYMEGKLILTTDTLKDWEGIKVSLYEYKETAKAPLARVYLANADATKIATWIITSCVELTGKLEYKNSSLLIFKINEASNGQFPVLGVVVENGYPYIFKDGVTVKLNKAIANYLDLDLITDDNIKKTMKFGRIISTTRQEYNVLFPSVSTTGHKWRNVIRDEYKKALESDTNNLIIAWAKGRIK